VSYLSLTSFYEKIYHFSRPQVSKRDSTILLCAILCGVEERWIEGEKEQDCERSKNREKSDESSCILAVPSLASASRYVVHIRVNRKIDKKRRFVKCRGRFSLLAVADRGRGWK